MSGIMDDLIVVMIKAADDYFVIHSTAHGAAMSPRNLSISATRMSNSNTNIRNPASEIKVVFYAGNNRLDGHNASSVKSNLLRLLFFVAAK